MIPCSGCHRHVRADSLSCPFCEVPLAAVPAPTTQRISTVALAAGLSLLGCTEPGDPGDSETNAATTSAETESGTTLGDGDGDTQETFEEGGADYGGPPVCPESNESAVLSVGSNPIDLTDAGNTFTSTCGSQSGSGPDAVYQFTAPSAGTFDFELVAPSIDGWLLEFDTYDCFPYVPADCVPTPSLNIELAEGQTLYISLDSTAGGPGTIEVTQS
ncbi:hypothetical protein [Enhygromyxa salina]|nr:hypothetical protein [Enhygromyxa salina]